MTRPLEIPPEHRRNAPGVRAMGTPEDTGLALLQKTMAKLGIDSLAGKDILDVGCATRFTQTIINRDVPIGSYTGIDVDEGLIRYLVEHVEDSRFRFFHWQVHNAMYAPKATSTIRSAPFPVSDEFDIIWLFSVFTHLAPDDADALLGHLRGVVRPDGVLFFSALLDETLKTFKDRVPDNPLLNAYYGTDYLRSLLQKNRWEVVALMPPEPPLIQHHFICRPA